MVVFRGVIYRKERSDASAEIEQLHFVFVADDITVGVA